MMMTDTQIGAPYERIETLDGGEFIVQRSWIVGVDSRIQGINSRHSVLIRMVDQVINIEVSASVYEKYRSLLLGETDA